MPLPLSGPVREWPEGLRGDQVVPRSRACFRAGVPRGFCQGNPGQTPPLRVRPGRLLPWGDAKAPAAHGSALQQLGKDVGHHRPRSLLGHLLGFWFWRSPKIRVCREQGLSPEFRCLLPQLSDLGATPRAAAPPRREKTPSVHLRLRRGRRSR